MKIAVGIKQVPDTETKIKLSADQSAVDLTGVKWIVSPYDEFAIEEALRVRDRFPGSTVTVFAAGPGRVVDAIRTALAMGADAGVHLDLPEDADSAMISKALAAAIQKEGDVELALFGKEAIDDGAALVPTSLGSRLNWPVVNVVLSAEYNDKKVQCRREIEGGAQEVVEVSLPAIITAQKGLNEPRYASLPNIMKAKKKEVRVLKMDELGVSEEDRRVRLKAFELPAAKGQARTLGGSPQDQAQALVKILHEELKII